MPDITMCTNTDCPLRDQCYRFKAEPSMMQSYQRFDEVECKFYIPVQLNAVRTDVGCYTLPYVNLREGESVTVTFKPEKNDKPNH